MLRLQPWHFPKTGSLQGDGRSRRSVVVHKFGVFACCNFVVFTDYSVIGGVFGVGNEFAVFVGGNRFVGDVVDKQHAVGRVVGVAVADTYADNNGAGACFTVEQIKSLRFPAFCLFNFKRVGVSVIVLCRKVGGGVLLYRYCSLAGVAQQRGVQPDCDFCGGLRTYRKTAGKDACVGSMFCSEHVNVCVKDFVVNTGVGCRYSL